MVWIAENVCSILEKSEARWRFVSHLCLFLLRTIDTSQESHAMNHLQTFGQSTGFLCQRTDSVSTDSTNPLPWLIRHLVREQVEQTAKSKVEPHPSNGQVRDQ